MKLHYHHNRLKCALFFGLGIFLAQYSGAQTQGQLYDPEPPPKSAYVRVILANTDGNAEVLVDGKTRIRALRGGDASKYMIIPDGDHTLTLRINGKESRKTIFSAKARHALSVAFAELPAGMKPLIFEDKTNSNKLKAMLSLYNLNRKEGSIDVLTADGKTKVFADVATGTTSARAVNPISIDLVAVKSGGKEKITGATLAMVQGGAYSLLLLSNRAGKPFIHVLQNTVERYSGQ